MDDIQGRTYGHLLALFLLVVSAGFYSDRSVAQTAGFRHSATAEGSTCYATREQACNAYANPPVVSGGKTYSYWSGGNTGFCKWKEKPLDYAFSNPEIVSGTVTTCVIPEANQCESATGDFVHEYNAGSLDPSVPPSLPPSSICESGCLYNRTATVKGCNRFLEDTTGKDLNSVYCKVVYQGAGSQCTSNNPPPGSVFDQPPSKPPADSTPQFTSESLCGDWVTNADGSQSRNCTSSEKLKEPGQLNCSNAADYLHCTTGKPAPRLEDTTKTEDITKTTNPDGSTKTETNTTTDKTVCVGTKPCTSTTAEESSTSETDANGKPGDETKSCTGSGCTPDEGEGEDEGEEGPERLASAGSCDAAFSCSGDPIDCEVLRQQKEQLCLAEEMTDFPKQQSAIEAAVTGDRFQLDEGSGVIDVPSFINQGTRFLPSACPAAESFSLTTAGGRTFQLSYEPLCRAASDLSGLFVAVATVLAALYVGRAVGGQ